MAECYPPSPLPGGRRNPPIPPVGTTFASPSEPDPWHLRVMDEVVRLAARVRNGDLADFVAHQTASRCYREQVEDILTAVSLLDLTELPFIFEKRSTALDESKLERQLLSTLEKLDEVDRELRVQKFLIGALVVSEADVDE